MLGKKEKEKKEDIYIYIYNGSIGVPRKLREIKFPALWWSCSLSSVLGS
jgi:hypothetical protein